MTIHVPEPDEPFPTLWTDLVRGPRETALDCETAVSLSCHLNPTFQTATSWTGLIDSLSDLGFGLEYKDERLILINIATGVELCTCSFLGHGVASLTARFGKPRVLATTGRLVPEPD